MSDIKGRIHSVESFGSVDGCSRILRVIEHKMDGPDNYDLATADTLTHTSGMYSYKERKDSRE